MNQRISTHLQLISATFAFVKKSHSIIRIKLKTNRNRSNCFSFILFSLISLLFTTICSANVKSGVKVSAERQLSSRIVTTKYGALRGFISTLPNRSLQPVEVFLGVPYASPPVGKLRFMPPVTSAHWSGVRSAHSPGSVCPQNVPNIKNETEALKKMTSGRLNTLKKLIPLLQNQSEDCLYLNIYAPAIVAKEAQRLPVIVFIHGESYEWNAGSSYDGSVLASFGNLVVVTINYRLGVLGFFPALDGSSRGNFGLMDQVAALHWVQENIGEFGGDASNVTVLGHKQGAACLNILMLSPMSRGLFHRAIMQSGSVLSPWAMATDAVSYSRRLAKKLGCPDDYGKNSVIVDCLRQKAAKELVSVNFKVPNHLTSLGPTVDGIVIPSDPSTLMAEYNSLYGNYDLMFGVTKVEYYRFTKNDERNGIDSQRRDKILRTLVRNLFTFHLQEIYLTVSNEYTDWTQSTVESSSIFQSVTDLLSDSTVVAPSVKAGQLHSRLQRNTYFYTFLYATEQGNYPANIGCVQGEDLAYVFGAPLVSGMQLGFFTSSYNKAEVMLSETVMNFWANFAKHGNPTANVQLSDNNNNAGKMSVDRSALQNVEKSFWPQYDEKEQQYMSITVKPKVRDHFQAHRLSYWLNLIPKLHIPGPASASQEHHLLQDFDDIHSYEGIVRESTVSTGDVSENREKQQKAITTQSYNELQIDLPSRNNSLSTHSSNDLPQTLSSSSPSTVQSVTSSANDKQRTHLESAFDTIKHNKDNNINASMSMFMQQGSYSTALSVTIAIGCSLLLLNILIFAGILYQKDRMRNTNTDASNKKMENDENVSANQKIDEMNMTKNASLHISQGSPLLKVNTVNAMYPQDYISSVTGGQHNHLIAAHFEKQRELNSMQDSPASGSSYSKSAAHVSMVNSIFYSSNAAPITADEYKTCANIFDCPQERLNTQDIKI